jgi:glycosyltransferase involved in cell wall biosynthesis
MKVLVVAAGPFPMGRGTPTRTLRVSHALAERGHDICVVAFPIADSSIETDLRIERSSGSPNYTKTSAGPSLAKLLVMSPRLATKVRELLEREPFDVIYAHHYEGLLVASAARRCADIRTPIIFDSHTLLGSEVSSYLPGFFSGPVNWIGTALDGRLIRLADAVISVTDQMTDFYAAHAQPNLPVVTATNGVESEKFAWGTAVRTDATPVRVVFAGNLSGYQGFDLLLAAFRKIRQQRQGIELLVAASEASSVLPMMGVADPAREGILVRSGAFRDLPAILASADIAVNPRAVCPGIPQKLLNYMAAALPTVSFEGSSAILVHEQTGLVVPNGDIDGFAAAIARLADSRELRLQLGSAARALVKAKFQWERVAVAFEGVCCLLEQSSGARKPTRPLIRPRDGR